MGEIYSLTLILIRPSNYDDEGYVIRYWRGVYPSNTLACMRSLTLDFSERWKKELGISITIETYDDLIEKLPYKKLAGKNQGSNKVVAALVGVQTNQFPRASDIAIKLTALGIKTLIGGFHISGILSMFDEPTPEIQELIDRGVTVVQGEAENVWESILYDVLTGKEKPLYRMTELPDISEAPVPQIDSHSMKKFALSNMGTIDCSRGCPFNCSFCTIINVQGRKMRYRCAESIIKTIRENYNRGIKQYFFTDDNFSRNPEWEPIFKGLIRLREDEGLDVSFIMQVDMGCDKIKNFIKKASQAGCSHVFIGMESINPKNIAAAGKTQNNVDNYASFVETWHKAGIVTHAGYIIGFPYDTPESIRRDIETLKNEIKVDMASFFILTPLPGSRDHYELVQSGVYLDNDLNKFDSFHTVTEHPLMTSEELYKAYQDAWVSFYEFDNLKNILMRARQKNYWNISAFNLMWYKNSLLEPRHPMVTGFIREKSRLDIRPGTSAMGFFAFHTKRAHELLSGFKKRIQFFFELQELWWLTQKPDEHTFKLVTDFTSALYDAKNSLSKIDLNIPYSKWCEEITEVKTSLSEKIGVFYNTGILRGKTRRRFNRLIEDMNLYLDKVNVSEHYNISVTFLTQYLSKNIQLVEDFSLKQVGRRRKITKFWSLTWQRIKQRKIIRFTISIPKIVISAIRDFRMSLSFTYHFFIHHSW